MKRLIALILGILLLSGCAFSGPWATAPSAAGQIPDSTPPDFTEPTLGVLCTDLLSQINPGRFTRRETVELDPEGEQVALYADGVVEHVILERGSWDEAGVTFTPEQTLYSAFQLDSHTLIVIRTFFGDVLPHLRVTYTGADGTVERYLFQSGKDGSILLTE